MRPTTKAGRTFGLQLICKHVETLLIERFTPRNVDIALAMIEGHAAANGRGWIYKIEDWTRGSRFEPIWIENI